MIQLEAQSEASKTSILVTVSSNQGERKSLAEKIRSRVMRHEIHADDVENEVSEEQRKCKVTETAPADFEQEVTITQSQSTSTGHTADIEDL